MKKDYINYFFLIIVSVLICVSCNNRGNLKKNIDENNKENKKVETNTKKNDIEELNLQKKVKSINSFIYDVNENFGEIERGKLKSNNYITFNLDGNFIEKISYDNEGNYKGKTEYEYNDMGMKIEENMYDSREFIIKTLNKYDDNKNINEVSVYNRDGGLLSKYFYNYDDKGNIIEKNKYDFEGVHTGKTEYNYDEKGNRIEIIEYNSNQSIDYEMNTKYDDKGNIIEIIMKNSGGDNKITFEYEFDKNNNWIKQLNYRNKIPISLTERTIEYY